MLQITQCYLFYRADYWKSKERKYCDFCKCWLGDDKMTISIHENGKRHKDNVAKRLSTIQKKSAKDHKANLKIEDEMRKMEAAALKAYMNDIEGNADLTSQSINETLSKTNSQLVLSAGVEETLNQTNTSTNKPQGKPGNKNQKKGYKGKKKGGKKDLISEGGSLDDKLWYEAKTAEGHIYYWHIQTNESVWEPPPQGFMSIEEQEKITGEFKEKQKEENEFKELHKDEIEAERLAMEQRERLKAFKAEPIPEPEVNYEHFANPANKVDPYGKWQTVETKPKVMTDLQLPKQEFVAVHVPALKPAEKPERVFKEKVVTLDTSSSSSSIGTEFKKRKMFGGSRKNARQRLDDD